MKQIALASLILLCGFANCSAGKVPPNWKKPIRFEAEEDSDEILVSVPLDTAVYSRSNLNLADLRILDAEGREVSYLKTLISETEKHVPDSLSIQEWESKITQIREDEEKGHTLIEFESERQPLTQLTLITNSRNFSRKVFLEIPEEKLGKINWKRIADETVSRFEFEDILEENLTLKFPESRHETYRLVIENRDSPPLKVDGLKTSGPQDQLVFLATPGVGYELRYGADVEDQPDYDTAALRRLLSEGVDPVVAELGDEVALSEEPGRKAWTFQRLINNRYLLGGLIVLVAIVLGVSLYRAGKKVSRE